MSVLHSHFIILTGYEWILPFFIICRRTMKIEPRNWRELSHRYDAFDTQSFYIDIIWYCAVLGNATSFLVMTFLLRFWCERTPFNGQPICIVLCRRHTGGERALLLCRTEKRFQVTLIIIHLHFKCHLSFHSRVYCFCCPPLQCLLFYSCISMFSQVYDLISYVYYFPRVCPSPICHWKWLDFTIEFDGFKACTFNG